MTIEMSKKYSTWLKQTENDMLNIFNVKSFQEFGLIVENNSLLMHKSIRDVAPRAGLGVAQAMLRIRLTLGPAIASAIRRAISCLRVRFAHPRLWLRMMRPRRGATHYMVGYAHTRNHQTSRR